jgi:pimeloyl-ACP methyl ester carboxylesterase
MKRLFLSISGLLLLSVCCLAFALSVQNEDKGLIDKEVSFKTADGWTIYGTLSIPPNLQQGEKIPGVVLIHSPVHDRDIYLGRHQIGPNTFAQMNLRTALGKTASLRIDIRGRGKSSAPQEYHTFTEEQRGRVALDVSGAIEFLGQQAQINANQIGVVAEGASAEAAVMGALKDHRVRALVLLSGRLGEAAKELIASRKDVPVLCLATKEDKAGLLDMADVYKLSRNPASDLLELKDIGIGNSMFIMWANKFPNEKPLEVTVADWFVPKLLNSPQEVSFKTGDGWTIYGDLSLSRAKGQTKVPAVILLHSYLTDRHVFDDLEQMLVTSGFAVLNIDFRGRGKSLTKGSYFELSLEERDKAYLDVRAAADFLAAQQGVNRDRLSIVATSIGVKYGLRAASSDSRIQSFVMLGGMPDRVDVEKSHFPILFVSSLGLPPIAEAFRGFYKLTKANGSQLVEYEGGAVGYQIFEIDDGLEPLIVRWLKPQLSLP